MVSDLSVLDGIVCVVMATRNATAASKRDVVVLALADAGGATTTVDTEDVAVAAHRLAPGTFAWRKYPDQIDLDMVRTSLRHAAEMDNPRLEGSVRTGWNLTATGSAWLTQHGAQVRAGLTVAVPANSSADRRENVAERRDAQRLATLPAFRDHRAGKAMSPTQAAAVFRIDVYTPPRDRTLKIERMRQAARDNPELLEFVNVAAEVTAQLPTR